MKRALYKCGKIKENKYIILESTRQALNMYETTNVAVRTNGKIYVRIHFFKDELIRIFNLIF